MAFEFDRIVPFDPRGDLEKSEIIDRFACSKLKYILAKINTCRNFLNVKTWTDDEDIYIYINEPYYYADFTPSVVSS